MKTLRKVVSLILCAVMLASACCTFAGCSEKLTKDNPGAIIPLYMTSMTSFDPATAYSDEAASKLLSLVYQGLFGISSSGKLEKELCKSYTYDKEENVLRIKLKTTKWSDSMSLDADDFVYAWSRILDPEMHSEAAPLLFGIKNALAVKNGDLTVSSLGVTAARTDTIEIELEEGADVDTLLYNLASVALYPVREDVVKKIKDSNWASLPAILATNGPFYVKKIDIHEDIPVIVLERNTYYYLDSEKNESLDKFVVPYRLNIYVTNGLDTQTAFVQNILNQMKLNDPALVSNKVKAIRASMPEEEAAKLTNADFIALAEKTLQEEIKVDHALDYLSMVKERIATGVTGYYEDYTKADESLLYNDTLPLTTIKSSNEYKTADMMITGSLYFNTQNENLSSAAVRVALSSVLDRTHIANEIIGTAKAAGGLISDKVFNTGRKTSFRKTGGDVISVTAGDIEAAKSVISGAGLSGKTITITVSNDANQIAVAEYVKTQWEKLGISVSIRALGYAEYNYTQPVRKLNKDTNMYEIVDEILYEGLTKDYYREAYVSGDYEVIFYDTNMLSTDAFAALAVFSPKFSGGAYDFSESAEGFDYIKHSTGYSNDDYNALMDAALAETDKAKRAEILHDAEELLMSDMPVCPLFYYRNAYVISDELSGVSVNYFGFASFKRTNYKGYVQAVETTAAPTTTATPAKEDKPE